jgi:hypothetical protein
MTDLSPAAQAVLGAFRAVPDLRDCPSIAAALRAAADTLVANEFWDKYPAIYYRKKLLAIAAELEGAQ